MGDSFAQDLVNSIHENKLLPDAQIRVRYMPSRCQIYRGNENTMDFIDKKNKEPCIREIFLFYEGLQTFVKQADMIVFAAYWLEWSAVRLPETLRNFEIPPQIRVIVLGSKYFGDLPSDSAPLALLSL